MSDTEEEIGLRDTEGKGKGETTLLVREMDEDDEKYSFQRFAKARSFRLGLVISLIVIILIVVALVITTAVLVTSTQSTHSSSSTSKSTLFSLEDIFSSRFSLKFYSAVWTYDNLMIHQSSESGLTLINPADNTPEVLISPEQWAELVKELGSPIANVILSHDRQWAMIVTNVEKVYRHSFIADYILYNISSGALSNIANTTDKIQLALWSPVEPVIAYVLDFDLYIYNATSGEMVYELTSDGARNSVYNGIPDWVYEEEILGTNFALWWAPDGDKVLYAKFNDSSVEEYEYPLYGSYLDPSQTQYTTIDTIPYPKPGTNNPVVSLLVTELSNHTHPHVLTPPPDMGGDHYFVFAGWINSSVAMVTWMNRSSDSAVYCLYPEVSSWQCDTVYNQTSSGWVELVEFPTVVEDTDSILTLASHTEGDDSFLHILEISPNSELKWRTSGSWEVTSIVGASTNDTLYISTKTSPSQRHLYSVPTGRCLTCSQDSWDVPPSSNPSIPSRCDYFSASCSPSLKYCLLNCYGPAVPYTLLVEYDGQDLIPIQFKEVNSAVHMAISNLSLPTVNNFTVPGTKSGEPYLNGQMMFPPGFTTSHQYPVLVYVYGGPYSQQVSNITLLSSLSLLYLCSNLSMIVVKVDGRGTGFRGDRFKFSVYKDLGHLETIDQIRAGRYLQDLKFVDSSKLAIYGASYGGYMAGMVGSSGSFVYSTAISQSPVTSWYYYDSVYTERYMDQPQNNQKGYQTSSVLERAKNLSDVNYLLIHGTGDDNVHFQHTAHLVQALTEKEIQFRVQFYTDKTHSLSGKHTRMHLYELITDFLSESFGLQ